MKSITVRLPDALAADIESESREAGISKSDVVRQRLENGGRKPPRRARSLSFYDAAKDLIENPDSDTPYTDLSARKKYYLKKLGYGKNRRR
jgi:Arc/MetJ-type ribon-helix-helix transcriptional regulator